MNIDFTKITNVEVDGIDLNDYPDFVDAFITSAEYDGREMTDEELDYINDVHLDFVQECVYNHLF
jgi:hypothetical protein